MIISALTDWFKNNKKSADVLLFYAFVCTLFALPFGTAPQNIFGALSVLIWIVSGRTKNIRIFYRNSWFWPVLVFMVIPWIGLTYTTDHTGLGLDYARKSHYWLYCLAAASISFHDFPVERLIYAFFAGLALNAFVAVLQIVGIVPSMGYGPYHGFGDTYSTLSAFLVIGILTASFFYRRTRENNSRFLFLFLVLFYFFHLVSLEGRNGYVTFIILSPLVAWNFFKKINILKLSFFVLLFAGLMYMSPVVRKQIDFSLFQVKSIVNGDPETASGIKHSNEEERTYITRGAVDVFLEHPVLGVGTGGFRTFMEKRGWPVDHPHNNILYMAVSFGLVGVAVLFWLFIEIIKNAWKNRKTPLGYFLLSTSLVIFISGVFNSQILDTGTLFIFALSAGFQQGFPAFQSKQPSA